MMRAAARAFAFATAAVLSAVAADGAQSSSQASATRYIVASEKAWGSDSGAALASLLRRILADRFVGMIDGKTYTKAQAIAEASAPSDALYDRLDYARVRFFGDTAVVQGMETWKHRSGVQGRYVWIDTWIHRDGRWRIAAASDATVPVRR